MYNAPYSELEYGARFPDAPKIFLNDQEFSSLWNNGNDKTDGNRVFLIVPSAQLESAQAQARMPLNPDATWLFAESGGKIAFVNQPLNAAQLSLAEIARRQRQKPHQNPSAPGPGAAEY